MYWRQKARLFCTDQQHTDQLETIVRNRLAGMSMRTPLAIQQSTDSDGTGRPKLIIFAEYNLKADADSVWADVTTARTNGWVVTPSFAVYASMNDDGTPISIIDEVHI